MRQRAGQSRGGAAVDNYLLAILLLTDHGQPAETTDLAAKIGVSPGAISQMLRSRVMKKLVKVEPYQGARLTSEGLHRALRIVRRHRLIEVFLHKILGFDPIECHARARAMQSVVDGAFEDRLDELLGHPKFDPHGSPIPARDATWPKLSDAPLLSLPPGTVGRLSRVTSEDDHVLKYLAELGFVPGVEIAFEAIAPFEGPVTLKRAGKAMHLGRRLAEVLHLKAGAGEQYHPPPRRPGRRGNGVSGKAQEPSQGR
jgi:DtxR family transcriptional regulator, Mn-dependent transcriptional regulator